MAQNLSYVWCIIDLKLAVDDNNKLCYFCGLKIVWRQGVQQSQISCS